MLKNAAFAIISRLATSFFLFLATTFWTSMVCILVTSVAFQSAWAWLLLSSMPLKLLPKVTIELQDTKSNRCLPRVLPPTRPSIAHTPSATSQSPGGCSPFWLLYQLGFWYLTLLLGSWEFWPSLWFLTLFSLFATASVDFYVLRTLQLFWDSIQLSTRQLHSATRL